MTRRAYSYRYTVSVLNTLRKHSRDMTREAYYDALNELFRSSRGDNGGDRDDDAFPNAPPRRSRKTDGVLTFVEADFAHLFDRVRARIASDADDANGALTSDGRLFAYVFYMLAIPGKRLSDVAGLSGRALRQLRELVVCVICIKKARKLGRIEIPEILDSGGLAGLAKRCGEDVRLGHFGAGGGGPVAETASDVVAALNAFEGWIDRGDLVVPFDREKRRRALDRELTRLHESVLGRPKPRGLSFHAARRMYAGYRFLHGQPVARLQEHLDHATRWQTNEYVNSCLYELLNRE